MIIIDVNCKFLKKIAEIVILFSYNYIYIANAPVREEVIKGHIYKIVCLR